MKKKSHNAYELTQYGQIKAGHFFKCLWNFIFESFYIYSFLIFAGLEDFENKVDKVTKGENIDGTSWISQIFNKYGKTIANVNKEFKTTEGLEPPMLDETWGLEKLEVNKASSLGFQQKHKPNEDQFEKDLNGM